MKSTLDTFIDSLQDQINEDGLQMYGKKGFDRWMNPKFTGYLEEADASAALTGSCGDTMEVFIQVEEEQITDISYRTDGCASSAICGSFAAELAREKTVAEVLDLSGQDVLDRIGRFPENERHCAHLAIATIQEAVNLYMKNKTRNK